MTKLEETRALLEKADKVKPLAEKDGKVYVDFDGAATLNNVNKYNGVDTGMQVTDAYLKGRPCILNYNFEDHSGFFSAVAILDEGKVFARAIFPRDIEGIALYADVDTGRLYGKETDMR